MRSPYMDILEQVTWTPKVWVLPDRTDAQIARICLLQMAKVKQIKNINVQQKGCEIIAWQGEVIRISFNPPKRPVRPVGRPSNAARAIAAEFTQEATG